LEPHFVCAYPVRNDRTTGVANKRYFDHCLPQSSSASRFSAGECQRNDTALSAFVYLGSVAACCSQKIVAQKREIAKTEQRESTILAKKTFGWR
jgi:hypothetical protein